MAIPVIKFSISRDLTVYPQFIQFDATNEHVPNIVFYQHVAALMLI